MPKTLQSTRACHKAQETVEIKAHHVPCSSVKRATEQAKIKANNINIFLDCRVIAISCCDDWYMAAEGKVWWMDNWMLSDPCVVVDGFVRSTTPFPIFELLHCGTRKWTQLWLLNIWVCICCQANLLVLHNSTRMEFLKKEKQRDRQSPPTDEQVGCVGSKCVPRICFIHHGGGQYKTHGVNWTS